MKLRLVVVGKLKDSGLRALCDDYQARIGRYCPFQETELRDANGFVKAFGNEAFVVALEVNGQQLSSLELSAQLARWSELPRREVVFLIGGADGIPSKISERADATLSLSRLTLPHRLARLILCEQLYRALSIARNEPYARED